MTLRTLVLSVTLCSTLLSGCATKMRGSGSWNGEGAVLGESDSAGAAMAMAGGAGEMGDVQAGRLLVWTAELQLQVPVVSNAVAEAILLVRRDGGFIAQNVADGGDSATLVLHSPSQSFEGTLAKLEALGTLMQRNVAGTDVTEQMVDVEARLANKRVTRDRLKELLDKAKEVKDVLAIETEFERVQSDIDSMEGRLKKLQGQIQYAMVVLKLEKAPPPAKKRILGPLGLLFHAASWCVEKLFVIQE